MIDSYNDLTKDIAKNIAELRTAEPDTMKGFNMMAQAASAEGTLDPKTKELIALAIGVAVRCDGCIGFHTKTLAKLGTAREEITETLAMSIYMGGGPSLMYAANAIKSFDEFNNK